MKDWRPLCIIIISFVTMFASIKAEDEGSWLIYVFGMLTCVAIAWAEIKYIPVRRPAKKKEDRDAD